MRPDLTALSILGIAAALILGACSPDGPTRSELAPGEPAYGTVKTSGQFQVPIPARPGVVACINAQGTEECVTVPGDAGGTFILTYQAEATGHVPTASLAGCPDGKDGAVLSISGLTGATLTGEVVVGGETLTLGPVDATETANSGASVCVG